VAVPAGAWGKAIVYAPRRVAVGDTLPWLERGVRDVPPAAAVVEEGHPICTVLADGAARAACAARLQAEAEAVLAGCRPAPARA
jgi:predicted ATP-grasp superfamily ATP-dependent carboligase